MVKIWVLSESRSFFFKYSKNLPLLQIGRGNSFKYIGWISRKFWYSQLKKICTVPSLETYKRFIFCSAKKSDIREPCRNSGSLNFSEKLELTVRKMGVHLEQHGVALGRGCSWAGQSLRSPRPQSQTRKVCSRFSLFLSPSLVFSDAHTHPHTWCMPTRL